MSSSFNNLNSDLDNINDNINHHCSFCGNIGHDIRFCDSPDIPSIEHTIANIYVSNLQESVILELNDVETEARFVNTLLQRFLLRNIRVLAVTSGLATASGYNKSQYATVIYKYYHQTFLTLIDIINLVNNEENTNNHVRNLLEEFNEAVINGSGSIINNNFNITPVLNIAILNDEDSIEDESKLDATICECGICLEDNITLKQMVKLNCEHSFCSGCIVRVLETTSVDKVPTCAFCRAGITDIETNCLDIYGKISEFCNY
jgi:hypothetical protein